MASARGCPAVASVGRLRFACRLIFSSEAVRATGRRSLRSAPDSCRRFRWDTKHAAGALALALGSQPALPSARGSVIWTRPVLLGDRVLL